ncbi:hypothetical protein [Chondromyces apiculatus]|uniref:Uncharacterized protein n=1 Tax=Chondromyces apiculatus DSM 436 TaxID=1192034 RepID=A0A017SX31_9BACT|nr:hypothetical protein [Chondromyces apiculatus]EYF01503.1 Hypothetical protein CAP_8064 [Chondromyces apiculatus DSM 436]
MEQVGEADQEVIVDNALTANALTANALTANALTANALTANALTANALTANALTSNALKDPKARQLLKYIVSCALDEDAHINVTVNGQVYGFDGELGLAKKWGKPNGKCDSECRTWVSGCVLSRVDYLGEPVDISIRGKHDALQSSWAERVHFNKREATYYGNIFAKPQQLYACLSPGKHQIPRVCGPNINNCFLDVVGHCDDLCKSPSADGSFPKCEDDQCHGDKHEGSVTVFLE